MNNLNKHLTFWLQQLGSAGKKDENDLPCSQKLASINDITTLLKTETNYDMEKNTISELPKKINNLYAFAIAEGKMPERILEQMEQELYSLENDAKKLSDRLNPETTTHPNSSTAQSDSFGQRLFGFFGQIRYAIDSLITSTSSEDSPFHCTQ